MACKNCTDCKDNGCAPLVYPKCFSIDKKYACLGLKPGDTGADLLKVLNDACASWGGGTITANNGLTKTGSLIQLGGALVKDTVVTAGAYDLTVSKTLAGDTYVFGVKNAGLFSIPGALAGIFNGNNDAQFQVLRDPGPGGLTFYAEAVNGLTASEFVLSATGAKLQYAPNGGSYLKVFCDVTGITHDGQGLPTMCDATQIQEDTAAVIYSAPTPLPITTGANLFRLTTLVAGALVAIDSTPIAGTIQDGTRITLQFDDVTPPLLTHTAGLTLDTLRLKGCVNWQPSQYDTITLTFNGTQWNEISRKECADPLTRLIADVAALETCVYDASGSCPVDEAWKTVNTVGNMVNGQPIPTFNLGASLAVASYRLALRMQADGKVEIRGNVRVTDNGTSFVMFTLPTGYRPTLTGPLSLSCIVEDVNDASSLHPGLIAISAGGAAVLVVDFASNDKIVYIPPQVISLD